MTYYADDRLTLLLGDARDQLATVEPGSVQTIVTSPPYFGLRDYGTAEWEGGDVDCKHGEKIRETPRSTLAGGRDWQGKASSMAARSSCPDCGARRVDKQIGLEDSPSDFVASLVEVFAFARETLTDTGTLWLNIGDTYDAAGLIGVPWMVAEALRSDGWRLVRDIIWAKTNAMPESADSRLSTAHEYVFMLAKTRKHFYEHRTDKHQRSVWAGPTAGFGEAHFAVMPEWLARRCILLGSRRGETVLDPFAGAGTTPSEALVLGRNAVAVELSEQNCAMILRRTGRAELAEVE